MHKIAGKVAKRFQKTSTKNVVSMEAYQHAKHAITTIKKPEVLVHQGYQPVHACYVHAQNLLSVIVEGLLLFPELDRFNEVLGDAEEEYMPGGPPMSPVTTSYFTSWSSFDVPLGLHKETLISIVLELKHLLKLPADIVTLFEHFQHSRMGIYEHLGIDQTHVFLRDLVTQETFRVFNPTGYLGKPHELWFVRLLPNLVAPTEEKIGFTTPYVLTSEIKEWQAYFKRGIWRTQKKVLSDEYLLKYGLSPCYWLEYIMQAYSNINKEGTAILLYGVPDLSKTRPHFSTRFASRLPEYNTP